jgi:hypothetical protein
LGNFDVKITIDKNYVLGGTGYLQNKMKLVLPRSRCCGQCAKESKTLTWHFNAPMVHDFTWAADKDYIHDVAKGPNGVDIHFLYKTTHNLFRTGKITTKNSYS